MVKTNGIECFLFFIFFLVTFLVLFSKLFLNFKVILKSYGKLHTIRASINGALPEHHDVLGEGARLVGEDELHLTQLLVQGGGASFCRSVCLTVVHLPVPVNEVAVTEPQNLHTEGKHFIAHQFEQEVKGKVSC